MAKSKWLGGILNGNDKDAPTWRGVTQQLTGDFNAKRELLSNLKRQMNLPQSHSFVAGK